MNNKSIPLFQITKLISNGICRLCGRQDLKVIDVYSKEAMQNDISNKIEMHIPIKLVEFKVPCKCCLECISTILSWHSYVLSVLENNQRISSLTNAISTSITYHGDSERRDLQSPSSTSLQTFHRGQINGITNDKLHNENNDSEDNTEETDVYNYAIYESSEDEGSGSKQNQEKRTTTTTRSLHIPSKIESKKPLCHASNEFNDISDGNDSQNKQSHNRGFCTKIDPEIIEAAKVVVDDRTYYNCKECGKSLLSPYTYVWHMRIHTGERPFMCDLCGKQFRVSQGLVRHLKETHKRIKNFPCDLCGRMFATKRNVDEHRRIHTNERPYVCALCSKSFKQKASLFVHNRTHSDNFPFKCDYCNQGFRTKPPLLIHVTKHTGQKPYPCDVCGRCFRIKYELKRHKLVHSEEKPFECSSCGLRFKQKRYLRNHFKANHPNVT